MLLSTVGYSGAPSLLPSCTVLLNLQLSDQQTGLEPTSSTLAPSRYGRSRFTRRLPPVSLMLSTGKTYVVPATVQLALGYWTKTSSSTALLAVTSFAKAAA